MDNLFDFSEENTVTVAADESNIGLRADAAVAAACENLGLPITRSAVQRLAESGALTLNGKAVAKKYKVAKGDVLVLTLPEPEPPVRTNFIR